MEKADSESSMHELLASNDLAIYEVDGAHPLRGVDGNPDGNIGILQLSNPLTDQAAEFKLSIAAFATLSQLEVRGGARQEDTLVDMISAVLQPMIQDWLDRELPGMVERLIALEIRRIGL
jgi:hypothetical protein